MKGKLAPETDSVMGRDRMQKLYDEYKSGETSLVDIILYIGQYCTYSTKLVTTEPENIECLAEDGIFIFGEPTKGPATLYEPKDFKPYETEAYKYVIPLLKHPDGTCEEMPMVFWV